METTQTQNAPFNYNDGLPIAGEPATILNGKTIADWDCRKHARACVTCCDENLRATGFDQFDRVLTECPNGHVNVGMPTNAYFEGNH